MDIDDIDLNDLYEIYKRESGEVALINDKESKAFIKWKKIYEIRIQFENTTGLKSYHKGKETKAFIQWKDMLEKQELQDVKFIVKYFPSDDFMRCYEIKERKKRYNSSNQLVWSLNDDSKEFILDKVGYMVLGIPLFIIVYNKSSSIPLELCFENDKLVFYGCNSFDMYNKHHSDIFKKAIKQKLGKLYGKVSVYLVIYVFSFMIPFIPTFAFIFLKYFG